VKQPILLNSKKSYETPKLTTHGDIRELTKATGTGGKSDGGVKARKHTG
jgi:hypothetical protein